MSRVLRHGWLLGALGLACTERVIVDVEGAGAVAGVEEGNAGEAAVVDAAGAEASDPDFECGPLEARCEGECVYVRNNPDNCGACGVVCDAASGAVCHSSTCYCSFDGDHYYELACDGVCPLFGSDNNNCGACGVVCDAANGMHCYDGHCGCGPVSPSPMCYGDISLPSAAVDCGDRGHECPLLASCVDGACTCPYGLTHECGGECVVLESDAKNCGACSNECDSARRESCVDGACQCGGRAPAECGGLCVDTAVDPQHCGGCGAACPLARPYCIDGVCSEDGPFSASGPDAMEDYLATALPSGAWSWGWAPSPAGPFAPSQVLQPTSNTEIYLNYAVGTGIWRNTSSTEYFGGIQPLDLVMNPGCVHPGLVSVVRWTAPRAATCDVDGHFLELGAPMAAGMIGFVVVNGDIVFTAAIVPPGEDFHITQTVAAGDTVDFVASAGPDGCAPGWGITCLRAWVMCR